MEVEGGCYCGAVRYKASGEPLFKGQCHCRECPEYRWPVDISRISGRGEVVPGMMIMGTGMTLRVAEDKIKPEIHHSTLPGSK